MADQRTYTEQEIARARAYSNFDNAGSALFFAITNDASQRTADSAITLSNAYVAYWDARDALIGPASTRATGTAADPFIA